jgi:hypothetical protein
MGLAITESLESKAGILTNARQTSFIEAHQTGRSSVEVFMKKLIAGIAIVSSVMLSPVLAQTDPGGPQPPNGQTALGGRTAPSAQMQAAMKKYQPVMDLVGTVNLLAEMDKVQAVAISKDQAKKLAPILKDLGSRADLKPADATKILTNLEDKILTDKQVTWLDDAQLKRQEERRKRAAQTTGSSVRLPGLPSAGSVGAGQAGAGQNANRPAGAPGGDRQAQMEAMLNGKPFNPFKSRRGQENLKALTALVAKRV